MYTFENVHLKYTPAPFHISKYATQKCGIENVAFFLLIELLCNPKYAKNVFVDGAPPHTPRSFPSQQADT